MQDRIRAQKEQHILEEKRRLEEQRKRELALQKEKEEQAAELKKLNDQHAALKEIKEQHEELHRIELAAQKKELDFYAQEKAKKDAARHENALEQQQEYIPMDLKPSAPAIEELKPAMCIVCNNKASSKPLPCKRCKKKSADICNICFKHYGGQCPTCWNEIGQFIKDEKGECSICFEDKRVTLIPCEKCQKESSTARICAICLKHWLAQNQKNQQPRCCPHCHGDTLNEALAHKLAA
jgi:hypothetical protein